MFRRLVALLANPLHEGQRMQMTRLKYQVPAFSSATGFMALQNKEMYRLCCEAL